MNKTFSADPELSDYASRTFAPEDQALAEIRSRAERAGLPPIHVGEMDGLHLEVLTRMSGAAKGVEIGTLAGYSGLAISRGLAKGGKLWTFEFEPRHAEVARETFKKAGLRTPEQVEILVGPAIEKLPEIEKRGPFDLVFIDADKESYPAYLAWAAANLRVGGVVLGDNTFAWGMIAADPQGLDPEERAAVEALRAFNAGCADARGRFRATILPTGEGLTVAVKVR